MVRRRRTLVVAASAVLVVAAAAACQPYFDDGATATATPLGRLARLTWTAAVEDDAGQRVVQYGIEVDGVEVTRFPAPGTSCVLTGLAGGSHTVSITAYGNTGEHSGSYTGDLASLSRVTTTVTTAIGAPAGGTSRCVAPTDSDGDRLPDAVETGDGAFDSAGDTGTKPNDADSDDDGIRDGDETLGTSTGVDLYAMGTRPGKKDLLFELDWFNDAIGCASHSHRPTPAILARVQTAFAATAVANPDGTTGINVIGDYGQGGAFAGGNLIADADGLLATGVNGTEFKNHKAVNFAPAREGIFHYVMLVHRYDQTSGSSGQAELGGDDLIVSLQCSVSSVSAVGNTIMHEVGHNLNLRHGGGEDLNYKPNYNSVMNYQYQFPGVDTNCTVPGDGLLAYSPGTRAALNENALLETNGICNGVDVDWNANGTIDAAPLARSINGDTFFGTLTDHNDVANLCLTCVADSDGAPVPNREPNDIEIITEQDTPPGLR